MRLDGAAAGALVVALLAGCTTGSIPEVAPAQPVSEPTVSVEATSVPSASSAAGAFRWKVSAATTKSLGASWHRGCPVSPASLRSVSLRYWGFDRRIHDGSIVLNRTIEKRARAVFAYLYEQRFPLRSIIPVSRFPKASDDASMAADNTSAFNCRLAVASGPASWSKHAYGTAIDVNPVENPYLFNGKVLPPAGAKYRSRATARPGLIRKDDPIYDRFIAAGFTWGGRWSSPDYQHFER